VRLDESQANLHHAHILRIGGSRTMRFWVSLASIPLFVLSACGETNCSLPEDPRARADELIQGCFTGTTYCEGPGLPRVEGLETVSVENWSQIQTCGRSVRFDRIEERRGGVSVVYVCDADDRVAEYWVSFSPHDPVCESVLYGFYVREEYEAH
jgi:hypothetical protein